MKKNKRVSPVSVLGGGRKTAEVVAEARRLTAAVRKLGVKPRKSECRLGPPLGTTLDRASRFRSL